MRLVDERLWRRARAAGRRHAGQSGRTQARSDSPRRMGAAGRERSAARAGVDAGNQADFAQFHLCAQQILPGAHVRDHRARLRHPDGRAAFLQRLRGAPGALQSLHGRDGDLRRAPSQQAAAARIRGRASAARLRSCARRSRSVSPRARNRAGRGRRLQCRLGRKPQHRRSRARSRRRQGRERDRPTHHREIARRRHPALLRGHREEQGEAGLFSEVDFRAGLEELAGWLSHEIKIDHIEHATTELTRRGLVA